MKILLLTDSYPPEIRSASHLMFELAEELRDHQHEVTVITLWPKYNLETTECIECIKEYQVENGIRVLRVKSLPIHRVGYIIRGLSQLVLPFFMLRKLKQHKLTDFDVVIVYSPPLPLAFVGERLQRLGSKFIFNVQDIFPKNAIDLGVLRNRLIIKFYQWFEYQAYKKADFVLTHSEGNTELLKTSFPTIAQKFKTLHNWIDVNKRVDLDKRIDFREKFNLGGKLVIVFAGVLGPSQNLSFVLDVANALRNEERILFLFIGDGDEKQHLQNRSRELNLKNVIFKPFISHADYPSLLAVCDIGLISLSSKNKTPVVPGKLLGYMASALPVIAFVNAESDAHDIIKCAQCGFSVKADNLEVAVAVVRKCCSTDTNLATLGQNGKDYATQHFSKQKIVNQLRSYF